MIKSENITLTAAIPHATRSKLLQNPGLTIWFTGLSASGKSTLAIALEHYFLNNKINAYRLDGDNIRFGLNSNLGFSPLDRQENIRRVGQVSLLFADSCCICLSSFISPYSSDRDLVRKLHEEKGLKFVEVFLDVSVECAECRDPKGLYKKARYLIALTTRNGEIKGFTGIDAPYEKPLKPEIHIKNDGITVDEGVEIVLEYLRAEGILKQSRSNKIPLLV
jgi:adenylylsulfate kinase